MTKLTLENFLLQDYSGQTVKVICLLSITL